MTDSVERLYKAVVAARDLDPLTSRTAKLLRGGQAKMAKKLAEEAKVVIRNARRDGNKHTDALKAAGHIAEDEIETLKEEVQSLLKKYEAEVDKIVEGKSKEITQV